MYTYECHVFNHDEAEIHTTQAYDKVRHDCALLTRTQEFKGAPPYKVKAKNRTKNES